MQVQERSAATHPAMSDQRKRELLLQVVCSANTCAYDLICTCPACASVVCLAKTSDECMQMFQGQLGETDFSSLLDQDGQVQALKMELEEVKQADDEEIDRLLDQNGTPISSPQAIHPCNSVTAHA